MKINSITFLCDGTGCLERFTSESESDAGAYLDLIQARWSVVRSPLVWKHYCSIPHNPRGGDDEA